MGVYKYTGQCTSKWWQEMPGPEKSFPSLVYMSKILNSPSERKRLQTRPQRGSRERMQCYLTSQETGGGTPNIPDINTLGSVQNSKSTPPGSLQEHHCSAIPSDSPSAPFPAARLRSSAGHFTRAHSLDIAGPLSTSYCIRSQLICLATGWQLACISFPASATGVSD